MKTPTLLRHLVIRVCMLSGTLAYRPAMAQVTLNGTGLADGTAIEVPVTAPIDGIRFDLVDAAYMPCAYHAGALRRELRPLEGGACEVRVVDAGGILRMTGSYSDMEARLPDGWFEYYRSDGSLESRGLFVHGLKWGAWERYAADGSRLPDRIYATLSADEIQSALGLASEVCTL